MCKEKWKYIRVSTVEVRYAKIAEGHASLQPPWAGEGVIAPSGRDGIQYGTPVSGDKSARTPGNSAGAPDMWAWENHVGRG